MYVESHYPAFNPRPKYTECSDQEALRVLQKADRIAAATLAIVAPPVAAPLVVAVASTIVPLAVVVAPSELNPVVLSQPCLCLSFAPTMALHH